MKFDEYLKLALNLEKQGQFKIADRIDSFLKLSQRVDLLGPSGRTRGVPQIPGGTLFNPFAQEGQVNLTTGFQPGAYSGPGSNQFMQFYQMRPEELAKLTPSQRLELTIRYGRFIADQIAKQVQKTGFSNIQTFMNVIDRAFSIPPYLNNPTEQQIIFKENFAIFTTILFRDLLLKENNIPQISQQISTVLNKYSFEEMKQAIKRGVYDAIISIKREKESDQILKNKFEDILKDKIILSLFSQSEIDNIKK